MSNPHRNRRRGKRPAQRSGTPQMTFDELWNAVPAPDEPESVVGVSDPSVVIDSLGQPPLRSQGQAAEHYVASVVERAAVLATAIAQSAGILAGDNRDNRDDR